MIKLKTFEEDFDFSNTPYLEVKYKKIRDGLHLINYITDTFDRYIQCIIERMLDVSRGYFNQYDQCYLDVKVRDLNVGDSGDHFNEWHTDWVKDINHPNKPETHFIYTNIFGTHYVENGLEQQCENNSIYMYKRDLHKSPIVTKDCKRVLIRLSFVDRQKQYYRRIFMEDVPVYFNGFIPHFDVTVDYQENDLCYYDGILSIYTKDRISGKLVWMNKDNCHQYDMFMN